MTVLGSDALSAHGAGSDALLGPAERPSGGRADDTGVRQDWPVAPAFQVWLIAVLAGADMAAILAAAVLTMPVADRRAWVVLALAVAGTACLQGAGCILGMYDVRSAGRVRRGARGVLCLGGAAAVLALLGVFGSSSAVTVALAAIAAAVLATAALRLGVAAWVDGHADAVRERVLLIGRTDAVARLLGSCRERHAAQPRIAVVRIADPETAATGGAGAPAGISPLRDDAAAAIADFWLIGDALRACGRATSRVVVATGGLDEALLAATVRRLDHLPFEIALAPPVVSALGARDPLDRDSCVVLRRAAITPWGQLCKRALDLAAASAMLAVLAPMLLLVAALIRLDSPGPALFRQARWGWNNEPFTLLKFRTMWAGAPGADGSVQATRGDLRVTPIGRILRATSLDELPQLLNVLNGTMSLVGPRPHPVELNLRCLGVIDRYAARHRVVPGITGLAQIKGLRGETPTTSLMQQRVDYDIEYIRTRSLAADVAILFKTPGSVLRGVNAY